MFLGSSLLSPDPLHGRLSNLGDHSILSTWKISQEPLAADGDQKYHHGKEDSLCRVLSRSQ